MQKQYFFIESKEINNEFYKILIQNLYITKLIEKCFLKE